MSHLALLGGNPVRATPFPSYVTIGAEEKAAVIAVLESHCLSGFLGRWSPEFYGGPYVQALERAWEKYFSVSHAISVNSATSGLYAAVGAAGIEPGDEVIVSPYTMVASATAPLIYGAIPVFADIDSESFCISPTTIEPCITPRTKAIIVVDLFGHPADMPGIMELAAKYNLIVIEDAAQAIGATLNGRYAGTLADIGVFSLNYHKVIHCGEGGIVVTNDSDLAERIQLIRNHGEAVVDDKNVQCLVNIVGFNYRMTEIEAAIAIEQLKKLNFLVEKRREAAFWLRNALSDLDCFTLPDIAFDVEHGWYVFPILFNQGRMTVDRNTFVKSINAEGIPLFQGYAKPIYLEPLYQQRIAFGSKGFPFSDSRNNFNYSKGICPVAERMYFQELMFSNVCHACITKTDLEDFLKAF